MSVAFSGVTWDNPRGKNALVASTSEASTALGLDITWSAHSLEHFEKHPIDDLAERFNLVVMDHPHVGDMVASGGFVSLDDVLGEDFVASLNDAFVGPSLASYRMGGRLWALPLDAATQVTARRADLIARAPETWDEVLALSESAPVAMSVAGPHAFLSFLSVCASLGASLRDTFWVEFPSDEISFAALDIMRTVISRQPQETFEQNPIALLNTLITTDVLACIPLIYGYSKYATASPKAVTYSNAPRGESGLRGSTIGGAGLALTTKNPAAPELIAYMKWLVSESVQQEFIPRHDGQPALTSAWLSADVNRSYGNFYADTFDTITQAQVRPRFANFTAYQDEASRTIREGIITGRTATSIVEDIRVSFQPDVPVGGRTA